MRRSLLLFSASFLLAPTAARAQASAGVPAATRPAARPEDVRSADAIIAALYDVISGEKGQKRDWDRFRSLFAAGARLIPTGKRSGDATGTMRVWTVEEYVANAGPSLEGSGFFERELVRHTDTYGGVVQMFSSYDSRRTAADLKPFARGINSIQAYNDGARWWVVSIFWEGESPANPLPAAYLTTSP